MKLTITNGKKYNLRKLKNEMGRDFRVTQEPYTQTRADNTVGFFGLEIEVDAKANEEAQLSAIAAAHAPEMSDAEEAAEAQEKAQDDAEGPRIKRRLLKALRNDADFLAKVKAALT